MKGSKSRVGNFGTPIFQKPFFKKVPSLSEFHLIMINNLIIIFSKRTVPNGIFQLTQCLGTFEIRIALKKIKKKHYGAYYCHFKILSFHSRPLKINFTVEQLSDHVQFEPSTKISMKVSSLLFPYMSLILLTKIVLGKIV